jgi:hypothetical protein
MRITLKQLLRSFVEQGLEASDIQAAGRPRRAADLPRIDADLPLTPDRLSNWRNTCQLAAASSTSRTPGCSWKAA